MSKYNLISFSGIFIVMLIAWIFSKNRKNINKPLIFWCLLIQLFFIFIIFIYPSGTKIFLGLNQIVIKILDSASAGTRFLFGRLALPPGSVNEYGEKSLGFFLAIQAFPTIVFFSALVSILYFFRILPVIIGFFSKIFTKLMNISGAESLCASSNIFVGIESMLTVKPYLKGMTASELCTILTAGMATVASNVLGIYVFCLKDQFPNIAAHLISASFISVPAALIMSKLIYPESEKPVTLGIDVKIEQSTEKTLFEAIINGANNGVKLIVGISALLLAVLGLVELFNIIISALGSKLNVIFNLNIDWSLKSILGYLFYPVTLILGIPLKDVPVISKIIGERLIITEVGAYQDLALAMKNNLISSNRSAIIASYVLCGFTHIASLSIFVGGITALAPSKTILMSKIAFRALFAATLATLMTGCIAGTFLTNNSLLLG